MDLSLELGFPSELLARVMSEREFRRWAKYNRTRVLPTKRLELYMAQIAQMIALTMGGARNAKISDYLIELEPAPTYSENEVAALQKAFGYAPRKRK